MIIHHFIYSLLSLRLRPLFCCAKKYLKANKDECRTGVDEYSLVNIPNRQ